MSGGKQASDGGDDKGNASTQDDAPVGEAREDDAESTESGYRRDDYWRESAESGSEPDEVPEPSQGYAFEEPEKQESDDAAERPATSEQGREQGNGGGRDDARLKRD